MHWNPVEEQTTEAQKQVAEKSNPLERYDYLNAKTQQGQAFPPLDKTTRPTLSELFDDFHTTLQTKLKYYFDLAFEQIEERDREIASHKAFLATLQQGYDSGSLYVVVGHYLRGGKIE